MKKKIKEKEFNEVKRKKKLLFVDMYPTSLAYKLLYALKEDFDITLIILQEKTNSHLTEDYNSLGIKIHYFDVNKKKKELIKFFLKLIAERMKGYDYVLGKSGPSWFSYLIFKIFNSSKKIYFPYDIFLFLWKNQNIMRPKLGIMFEKSNLKNADFIINRCEEDETKLLRKDEVKKVNGKVIQFIPCFDDWIVPINKKKTKELSLVYLGVCPDKEIIFRIPWLDLFNRTSDLGIDQHIYPLKSVEKQEFSKIDKKNVFYHEPLPNKELNREISKYHYGTMISFYDKNIIDERFLKIAFGNKLLCYLEAGLPTIVDDETIGAEFVRKYNCGVVISEKDIPNLKKILKKQNYPELLKGVERAREKFRMSKNSKKIMEELNS